MRTLYTILTAIIVLLSSCSKAASTVELSYFDNYLIVAEEPGKTDVRWADYLADHLTKHTRCQKFIYRDFPKKERHITISVHVDEALSCHYLIERERESIRLTASSEPVMLWLVYQFIACAAEEDDRIINTDLPPAIITLATQEGIMPFEYRGIYSPTNADAEMQPIRGTNHVDYDWGLWGHNIHKAIGDTHTDAIYAMHDGTRTHDQYCFSSSELLTLISQYISDQIGTEGQRITIMPNDNNIVCTCKECLKAGNTATSATPAVAAMVRTLAQRFPKNQFFMTAYKTTSEAPAGMLPPGAGVMISTIDIPMRTQFRQSKGFSKFQQMLDSWKNATTLIYVWEYSRNFDDYLTPYPCLSIMQKRFQYYREQCIKGISINGSGDDYSTFDDLQTYVLSALMINPDINVDSTTARYIRHRYPDSHAIIADYYLTLEKTVRDGNRPLPYYGTIDETVESYLKPQTFETFWQTLDKKSKNLTGDERKQVGQLLTALCYTRLQLARGNYIKADTTEIRAILSDYKSVPRLLNYKETDGALEKYLNEN